MKTRALALSLVVIMIAAMVPAMVLPAAAIDYYNGYDTAIVSSSAIKVDGSEFPDAAYGGSEKIVNTQSYNKTETSSFEAYTAVDDVGLYFWIKVEDPSLDKGDGYTVVTGTDEETGEDLVETKYENAQHGDKVQLYIRASSANSNGKAFGSFEFDYLDQIVATTRYGDFNAGGVDLATSVGTDYWVAELYIPFTSLTPGFAGNTYDDINLYAIGVQVNNMKNDGTGAHNAYCYDTRNGGSYYRGLYASHAWTTNDNRTGWQGSQCVPLSFAGFDTAVVSDTVKVDGVLDNAYLKSEAIDDIYYGSGSPDHGAFTGYTVATEEGLYVFVDVDDDTIGKSPSAGIIDGDYMDICVQMGNRFSNADWGYIQLDYRSENECDSESGAINFKYVSKGASVTVAKLEADDIRHATTVKADKSGWTAEVFIPWFGRLKDNNFDEHSQLAVGLGIMVADRALNEDTGIATNNSVMYSDKSAANYWLSNTGSANGTSGNQYITPLRFNFDSTSPKIIKRWASYTDEIVLDGVMDEGYSFDTVDVVDNVYVSLENDVASKGWHYGEFAMAKAYYAFTDTDMYVFVEVVDNTVSPTKNYEYVSVYYETSTHIGKWNLSPLDGGTLGNAGTYQGTAVSYPALTDGTNGVNLAISYVGDPYSYTGYAVEFKMPLPESEREALAAGESVSIGVGVEINDANPEGTRQMYGYNNMYVMSCWNTNTAELYHTAMPEVRLDKTMTSGGSGSECKHESYTNGVCDGCGKTCIHNWIAGGEFTPPTHTDSGKMQKVCNTCGMVTTEMIPPIGHTFGEWSESDSENHSRACSCGETIVAPHTWDDGVVTIAPTHKEQGIKTYTCLECGAARTETITSPSHSFGAWTKYNDDLHVRYCECGEAEFGAHVKKTTSGGSGEFNGEEDEFFSLIDPLASSCPAYTCEICNASYYQHSWNGGVITTQPTSWAEGVKTYTCLNCGETKTESVPKLEEHVHVFVTVKKYDDKVHAFVCECGEAQYEKHVWDGGMIIVEATHTSDGEMLHTCTVCQSTLTVPISKMPHTFGAWEKYNDDLHVRVCHCGETEFGAHIPKTSGENDGEIDWGDGGFNAEDDPFSFTEDELSLMSTSACPGYTCEICFAEYTEHSWNEGKITTNPTVDKEGVKTYTCLNCGEYKYESVDKLPSDHTHKFSEWIGADDKEHYHYCLECSAVEYAAHNWDEGEIITESTHLVKGQIAYTCTDGCGITIYELLPIDPEHTFGGWSKLDDNKHIRVCECGETEYADHAWDDGILTLIPTHTSCGEMTYTCTECGAQKTELTDKLSDHEFGDWMKVDDDKHVRYCTCGQEEYGAHVPVVDTDPDDGEGGEGGEGGGDNDGGIDLPFLPFSMRAACESHVCQLCHEEYTVHTWDEGYVSDGYKTYTCINCGAQKSEPTDEPPTHVHAFDAWTYANDGQHKRACECGETEYADHVWDDGILTLIPTHTSCGEMTYTCTECGAQKTELTDKLSDHEFGDWMKVDDDKHVRYCTCGQEEYGAHVPVVDTDPDDGEGGEGGEGGGDNDGGIDLPFLPFSMRAACESHVCQLCHEEYTVHTWDEGYVSDGYKTYTCINCGAQKSEPTDEPPTHVHAFGSWTYANDGQHKRTCECGETEYADHAWDDGKITLNPTHTSIGKKIYTCKDCHSEKSEVVEKLPGHIFGAWSNYSDAQHVRVCVCGEAEYGDHYWYNEKVTVEPTHTKQGMKSYTCKDCETQRFETIEKLPDHDFGAWIVFSDTEHARACPCGAVERADHVWNGTECGVCGAKSEVDLTKTPYVEITCDPAYVGKEFNVTVFIKNNPGIWSLAFELAIDPDVFEFVKATKSKAVFNQYGVCSYDETTNSYKFNGNNSDPFENVTANGELVIITLKVKEGVAEAMYQLKALVDADNTIDVDGTNVDFYSVPLNVEVKDHEHVWDSGVITTEPTHISTGIRTFTCTECAETYTEIVEKLPNHEYGSWTDIGFGAHQRVCICGAVEQSDHKWDGGVVVIEPTHMTEGKMVYTCHMCGANDDKSISKLPDHEFGPWGEQDGENHTRLCICGYTETASHNWDTGVVTEPATHTREGKKVFTCYDCGAVRSEFIPMTPDHEFGAWHNLNDIEHVRVCTCGLTETKAHAWDNGMVVEEATHIKEGRKIFVCLDCGTIRTEYIEKLPEHQFGQWFMTDAVSHSRACICGQIETDFHNFDAGFVNKYATHISFGETIHNCVDCEARESRPIEKLPEHEFGNWVSLDGEFHIRICICGQQDMVNHEWDNGVVVNEATHLEYGLKEYTCTVCGMVKSERLEKLPEHNFNKTQFYSDELHLMVCDCGEYISEPHSWNDGYVKVNATHTSYGEKEYFCNECNGTTIERIEKLPDHEFGPWSKYDGARHSRTCPCGKVEYVAHSWSVGQITVQPTHTEEGTMTYTCLVCSMTRFESIEKLPEHTFGGWEVDDQYRHVRYCECGESEYRVHEWNEGVVVREATHVTFGTRRYTCDACGFTRDEKIEKLPEHTFGDWANFDRFNHYRDCACGERELESHVWLSGICIVCAAESGVDMETDPIIDIKVSGAFVGETFTVTVDLKNNPGIWSLAFELPIDTSVFEFVSAETKGSVFSQFGVCRFDDTTSTYKFNGHHSSYVENMCEDGTLVVITLKAKEGIPAGEYPLILDVLEDNTLDVESNEVEFAVLNPNVEVCDYILGDVNGDKKISNADVLMIYKYIYSASTYPLPNFNAADVTCDGKITNADVLKIFKYIFSPTLYPIVKK